MRADVHGSHQKLPGRMHVKILKVYGRGRRVPLGMLAKGVEQYRVTVHPCGMLILVPVAAAKDEPRPGLTGGATAAT